MSEEIRTVLMTAPDPAVAEDLVRRLVKERLAACGNVIPGLVSVYWWEGDVERADEALVVLKTTASSASALVERAAELHPYEVPEVIALPVTEGHRPYLEWVGKECRGA